MMALVRSRIVIYSQVGNAHSLTPQTRIHYGESKTQTAKRRSDDAGKKINGKW